VREGGGSRVTEGRGLGEREPGRGLGERELREGGSQVRDC